MILEIIGLIGTAAISFGAGLLVSNNIKNDNSPKVKVLRLQFALVGPVFVNMIEYEDKRSITYSYKECSSLKDDDAVDKHIKYNCVEIYNHIKLWLNFDINTYPDVSSLTGASYV